MINVGRTKIALLVLIAGVGLFLWFGIPALPQARVMNRDVAMYGSILSVPATCEEGTLYIPTFSYYTLVRCGPSSTWSYHVGGMQAYPPSLGDYAWVNQGGASTYLDLGGIQIQVTNAAGTNLRILKRAEPTLSYDVIMLVYYDLSSNDYNQAGVLWRQSADGKVVAWGVRRDSAVSTGISLAVGKYTDATTFDSWYAGSPALVSLPQSGYLWMEMVSNNVNRYLYYSLDGTNFHPFLTTTRTDFLTPDEIGFFGESNSVVDFPTVTLLSWRVL